MYMQTTKNCGTFNRSFFLTNGCKQVPPEECRNIIRWAHPDGYFLNAQGLKLADNLTPSHIKHCNSHPAPNLSNGAISCHRAMALAHYGPCPVFTDPKTGRKYKGHCHHLIPDLKNYRPANLLCWLTREQHTEADRRQRALRKCMPDLHAFTYERLRELQDPRTMPREEFEKQLDETNQRQRALRKHVPDLRAFTNERLQELLDPRTMPRERFEEELALIPVFVIDPDCDRREPYKRC